MELFFILLVLAIIGFVLIKGMFADVVPWTRKQEMEQEFIRRTDELYKQACEIEAFDPEAIQL